MDGGHGVGSSSGPDESDSVAEYEWTEIKPSTAVVETVADRLNRDVAALTPLYEAVDPDALDSLLAGNPPARPADVSVTFPYEGFTVTVFADGRVRLRPTLG